MTESSAIFLCRLDELQDPGSLGITVECEPRLFDLFVVRFGAEVRAYLNSCPHTGSPLDWMPDQFLSLDKTHIQCSTHHALFRIEDGLCIAGPCVGQSLKKVPVKVQQRDVVVEIEENGMPSAEY